ncbi:MAG: hypothetical protein J6U64_05320 [Alphaproteobacteria bacterium]|nr:hypothetical protein [Alphaproteobacteria bacterium]
MKNNIFLTLTAVSALLLGTAVQAQEAPAPASGEILIFDKTEKEVVDFPQRSSLGEVREAALPSLSESGIKDPSPMETIVSKKAPPSEQLLGRITSEVFHEMADLERGNVFLKLQAQREQLKNDLEKLKAQYRQARLDEIEKRENVIRSRVVWMQEQERLRQEILEKKLKLEMLEQEKEEAELRKEELLLSIEQKKAAAMEEKMEEDGVAVEEEVVVSGFPKLTIMDIKGLKGKRTARVHDEEGKVITLKVGDFLPSGHVVRSIGKNEIVFFGKGKEEVLSITQKVETTDEESVVTVE